MLISTRGSTIPLTFADTMRGHGRSGYGWVVVAISAFGLLFGAFPIVVSSFAIFFRSYVQEFHAGGAQPSHWPSRFTTLWPLFSPPGSDVCPIDLARGK
jgi:hypothetical protein